MKLIQRLNNVRISRKFPTIMLLLCFFSGAISGAVAIDLAAKSEFHMTESRIAALRDARISELKNYLASIEQDLSILAESPIVADALTEFKFGWAALEGDRTSALQDAYITRNPNKLGEKHLLDAASDGTAYSAVHAKFHPWFRHVLTARDYYDIFLFDTSGNLVYTVFKELDYATNLNTGEWRETDLGNAFRTANKAQAGEHFFFDFRPYAPSHDVPASFIAQPVFDHNGTRLGVIAFQMPIGRLNDILQFSEGLGDKGESYLIGTDGLLRTDARTSKDSTILKTKVNDDMLAAVTKGKDKSGIIEAVNYAGHEVSAAFAPVEFLGTTWIMVAEMHIAEIIAPIVEDATFISAIILAIMVVAAFLAITFARHIYRPIVNMNKTMASLAGGDLDTHIPGADRGDELGDMARSVEVFRDQGREAVRLKAEQEAARLKQEQDKVILLNELADSFDQQVGGMITALAAEAAKMEESARSMQKMAKTTNESGTVMAAATTQTQSNVETIASATEELSMASREISSQVTGVASRASNAANQAKQTEDNVMELNNLVENIGEVVEAIKDIAEQTNLLALNATIEAARAGDAGKGFAVVADEVKKLATETAKKTEEIGNRIGHIQNATESTVNSVRAIINNIGDIDSLAASTAGAVEEQTATTGSITENISEMAQAVGEVARMVTQVENNAGSARDEAEAVLRSAGDLLGLSRNLGESVAGFVGRIRTS